MGNRYLIDTHILLWWIFNDPKLDQTSQTTIKDPQNQILVSSASAWEIATKYRISKLPEAKELLENYQQILMQAQFLELSITTAHALRAGLLPIEHRDPFDRMIMAQSELEQIPVITHDPAFQTEFITIIPASRQ
ncbi:PilT protein domain protein [[Leptolyngbya] sp. PCC 7376]|uniref:type II toxin-antitoxin system VapC family toxin n=1 Tax=[Leptolyngbya] sp. PCC 7376 TaxID=111781 RepID=UPI00029EE6A4|nr:type II toxin-antitoxin system VapC family toxin [[Leptolyngbya] sp. PCC 7376]AFY37281.1 PilT protein domain protein [[Leptolyngbya] sp. PCC 7376]